MGSGLPRKAPRPSLPRARRHHRHHGSPSYSEEAPGGQGLGTTARSTGEAATCSESASTCRCVRRSRRPARAPARRAACHAGHGSRLEKAVNAKNDGRLLFAESRLLLPLSWVGVCRRALVCGQHPLSLQPSRQRPIDLSGRGPVPCFRSSFREPFYITHQTLTETCHDSCLCEVVKFNKGVSTAK